MLKKKITAIVLFLLVVTTLLLLIVPPSVAEARTLPAVDADIAECNALLKQLKDAQADIEERLGEVDSSTEDTLETMQLYAQQIGLIEAETALLGETIESYDFKQAVIEGESAVRDADLETAIELFSKLINYTFKSGDTSTFSLLFRAGDFSDFITRMDSANYIIEYSAQLVDTITAAQNDLDELAAELASTTEKLNSYIDRQTEAKAELEQKRIDLDARAAELGIDAEKLTAEYTEVSETIGVVNAKIAKLKQERQQILDSMSDFMWPLEAGVSYRYTSGYGYRSDPFTGKRVFHNGVDLACSYGTEILATKGGTVTTASYMSNGYGNYVVIYHGDGCSTIYGHASKLLVEEGDVVKQGQAVALVGSTGYSTGNHLHFTVLMNGSPVDPAKYLPEGYLD